MRVSVLLAGLSAVTLSGCATLEIHDDPARSGAPFHDVRPYVVVNQAADCTRTASVLSLPDTSKTYYVRPRGGLGDNKLSAAFANGMLTEFSQETKVDPSGLITTLADVFGIGGPGGDRGGDTESAGGGKGDPKDDAVKCAPKSWLFAVSPDGRLTPAFGPIN